MAWGNNYKVWKTEYPYRLVKNVNYTTMGIAIPTNEILEAISKELHNNYQVTTGLEKGCRNDN